MPVITLRKAEQIFMKFDIGEFCKELLMHSSFGQNWTVTGTLCEDLHVFMCCKMTGWGIPIIHKNQRSNAGKCARIVTLCTHCLCFIFYFKPFINFCYVVSSLLIFMLQHEEGCAHKTCNLCGRPVRYKSSASCNVSLKE
jgi:hypothetical protein